jgi:hypothetical protein
MVTTVAKTVGTGGDFSTWAAWFAAGPKDCTLNITANTGTGSTTSAIQLDAAASATAGAYIGNTLTIGSETRLITAYNATTKVATVSSLNGSAAAFSSAPGAGVSYTIGQVIWQGRQLKQKLATSTTVTISSRTVSATCYYEATTDTGASYVDDPGFDGKPYRLDPAYATVELTVGGAIGFDITIDYFKISKLQFLNSAASTSATYLYKGNQPNLVIDRCIFEGACNNTVARGVLSFGGGTLTNSLIVQKATGDVDAVIAQLSSGPKVYSTTFAAVGGTKLTSSLTTFYVGTTFKNVAIMGCAAVDTGALTHTVVKGYTDGTQTGWTTVPYDNTVFAKVATDGTHDFRLIATSPLKDAGTALTGAELTYTATDVGGRARPAGAAWDIGPWEYNIVDTTAPILSVPAATATSATTASGSVATNKAGGTLYFIASSNASPLAATVKLGGSASVAATGAQSVVFTGLSPSTTYYPSFLQKDTAGNETAVATGPAFTTPALDTIAPTWPNGASITPGTITTSSLSGSYPAASDNVGVHHYETSKDNGATWQNNGTGLTWQFSGLASGTNFPIAVSAVDAQGNRSALLTLSMSTSVAANSASFKSAPLENNAGMLVAAGTMISWEWRQARIGTQGAIIYGGPTAAAADHTVTATGLPAGAGALTTIKLGATWADDAVHYQPGTAA